MCVLSSLLVFGDPLALITEAYKIDSDSSCGCNLPKQNKSLEALKNFVKFCEIFHQVCADQ